MIRATDFMASGVPSPIPRMVVLTGAEEFLRTSCREMIIDGLGDDTDVIFLHWGEKEGGVAIDAAAVFDELRCLSLFGGNKVVVLSGARGFVVDARKLIIDFIAHESPQALLILEDNEIARKRGRRVTWPKAAEALVEGGALAIDCTPLRESVWGGSRSASEVARFLMSRAEVYGKTLAPDAAEGLNEAEGGGLRAMDSHIEKLSLAVGAGAKITLQDVEELVGKTRTVSVFELVDHIGARHLAEACERLQQIYSRGLLDAKGKKSLDSTGLTARLIPMIEARFHELGRAFELMRQGMNWHSAATEVFGEHREWLFEKLKAQSDSRHPRELGAAVCALCDMDFAIKTGGDPETLLTSFVVEHCSPAQSQPVRARS